MRSLLSLTVAFLLVCAYAVSPSPAAQANWTFMVFLNADNNLDEFGVEDINEMEKVGSSENLNIIVQIDREREGAKRYYIVKDTSPAIKSKILADLGEIDMGSYKELVNFVQFCKTNYPATYYCLDIWNHGMGWKSRKENFFRGISYDDQSGNHITTPQLGQAMAMIQNILGKKCDIVCMDACLMAMLEVAYEIHPYATYFCASEEVEPGAGYDYSILLPGVESMTPVAFAKKIVTAYAQINSTTPACYSAMDLSRIPDVAAKLDVFAGAINVSDPAVKEAVANAKSKVKRYEVSDYADLYHFAKLVKGTARSKVRAAESEATALISAISSAVILNKMTGSMKNSNGISIYLPKYSGVITYRQLALAKAAPRWVDFVLNPKSELPAVADISNAIRAAGNSGDGEALKNALATRDEMARNLENELLSSIETGNTEKAQLILENLTPEERELNAGMLAGVKEKVGQLLLEKESRELEKLYELF